MLMIIYIAIIIICIIHFYILKVYIYYLFIVFILLFNLSYLKKKERTYWHLDSNKNNHWGQ